MAHETVTKSQRFYCVSLSPDICKTPVGNSVVPIPYNITGEFKDAQAVSKDVKTHSEPVFLHDKSFIPSVKGDERGTLGGIKSGTFMKRVESLQFSPTKGSNGTHTIQESRLVWMNDRNTMGRVLERQVQAPRPRLKIFGKEVPASLQDAAQMYKDNYSASLHQFGGDAMDVGGKIGMGSAALGAAGAGVAATGVGLPVAAVMEAGAAAGGVTGGAVAGTGFVVDTGATVADKAADFILSGKMPDVMGVATGIVVNAAENFVFKKISGAGSFLKKLFKKKDVPGKTPAPPKKAPPPDKGNHDDGSNGGKVKQEKRPKQDKPADCCPKNTAPGGKSAKTTKPAHIGTGEEILYQTDFALEGPTPLEWLRTYRSGSETEDWSVLGARWASPYTASLSVCARGVVYHDATGRPVRLPALANGEEYRSASEGFLLRHDGQDSYSLTWHDGTIDSFGSPVDGVLPHGYDGVNAMLAPRAALGTRRLRLGARVQRDGSGFDVQWRDGAAPGEVLLRVATRDGLVVEALRAELLPEELHSKVVLPPRIGRLEQVLADGSRLLHASYRYACEEITGVDQEGGTAQHFPPRCHLVAHSEVEGAVRTYAYLHQLLVSYVNYAGLAFHLDWTSLEALRERWAGNSTPADVLAARYPINADNSYRARVVRSADADGVGETRLDYVDEDSTRVTEADGAVFLYRFNASWLATEVARIDRDGTSRTLGRRVWDRDGRLKSDSDALGNDTRYGYDDAGNLITVTDAKGQTTRIGFDVHNQPVTVTDPLGHTSKRSYDSAGRLLESRDPLGRVTTYAYDGKGRLQRVRDARGGVNRLTYDAAGRMVEYVDCSQNASRFDYDSKNQLTASVDAAGNKTLRHYDARGRLTMLSHPDGGTERFGYDVEGNLLEHTDQKGMVTRYAYNGYNLPVERRDPLGQTLRYEYDRALRLIALVNQNGESYRFTYDDDGRLASETGFDGKTTGYTYDRAGHLTARTAGNQHAEYARDALGLLQAIVTADGAVRYAFDAVGQLVAVSSGHADLRFAYDGAGQLIDERVRYRLPFAGAAGQETDPVFTLNHAYDELGNRIQTTLPNGRRVDTLRYGSGHWHGTLWQGRTLVDLEHDRLHRENQRHLGSGIDRLTEERTYDPASRLTSMVLRAGAQRLRERRYSYDLGGNLTAIDDARHGRIRYAYDPLGQLLAATQTGLHETFAFDPAGNLLDRPRDARTTDSSERASGRDLVEQPGVDAPRPLLPKVTHNLLQRYLGVSYTYDVQGNVVSRRQEMVASRNDEGVLSFEYDAENQLVATVRTFARHRVVARYLYDPFGRRIAKHVHEEAVTGNNRNDDGGVSATGAAATLFVWDGDVLAQEIDARSDTTYLYEPGSFVPLARISSPAHSHACTAGQNAIAEVFEWGLPLPPDEPHAHVDAWRVQMAAQKESLHRAAREETLAFAEQRAEKDVVHYYLCDHLGTPLELVDGDGTPVWSVRYRAWGGIFSIDADAVSQPLRFQGQYADAETGLHYNRFRYYDPHMGRFLSQDPIRLGGGENLYQYGPNPVWWVDPLGLAAGGGGAYMFETLHNRAYVGKGPYQRYMNSTKQRTPGANNGVDRGVHMDTKSPCSRVTEAQYAEMVEHEAMVAYEARFGSGTLLNSVASPGKKRLDPNHAKGKTNLKNCPGIDLAAQADGALLLQKLLGKARGTGL